MGHAVVDELSEPPVEFRSICYPEGEMVQARASVVEPVAGAVIRLAHGHDEETAGVEQQDAGRARLLGREPSEHLPAEHPLVPLGAGLHVADGEGDVRGPSDRRRHVRGT